MKEFKRSLIIYSFLLRNKASMIDYKALTIKDEAGFE